ncbi:von Willebrand factor type A domain protein [Variibacter gotjawalensis]|uniref:von Willebrand factor type A domain protein n=1 Tax=Variibacter gotjawalensis TaxID=1333996 RepID=A0A0S3PY32_9BRAD|nr:TadE/TadG family type IV pilus assembly protein [Variibacter gotjawalensis]NIK46657.1 Flp pilus assembly protein TadG/uncharacterized protein YegL [Variibacter gotjawalensis]RZS48560.1 Flp pilus assembly protein TadG [Variibacter gotjawalensis]BAT60822.1 von Willebrand factor type A domain protein [Variibacter gotjawalensis]
MFYRFGADTRGNIAIMFAFLLVPLIGAVGFSVDYGRATYTRSSLQNAIDAAALMVARELKKNPAMTAESVQTSGQKFFDAQFNRRFTDSATVTVTYISGRATTDGKSRVKIHATSAVDTTLMRLLGSGSVPIAANTEVVWGMKRLEIALALDNTGSMKGDKMTELKTATRKLLNELFLAAKKPGDTRVAIVPFSTDVNIGIHNVSATWLDWSDWELENRQKVCVSSGGEKICEKRAKPHSAWNGCVFDRDKSFDVQDDPPSTADLKTMYQPHQADNCPAEILPLTDILASGAWSPSELTSTKPNSTFGKKVDSLSPSGDTNVTIGLVWAWHALTKQNPLTEASDDVEDLEKIVILLTDGDNKQNRWGDHSKRNNIDDRTALACQNFKQSGSRRTIYTVRIIDGNADLLRNCASQPSFFYDVKSASDLSATFVAIAQNLTLLAISK